MNAPPPPAGGSAPGPGRGWRVLLVDLARGYGGPETRVLAQARALQPAVERCAVAVLRGSPLHDRLTREGVPVEPVSAGRADPRIALELRRIIRRGRYRIVDAHNIQSIVWGHTAALLTGTRGRVTTVHSDYGQEYTGVRRALYPAVYALFRSVTRQLVHVNAQLQQKAERRGYGGRSVVIPNAVPAPPSPPARDPSPLSEFGWTADDFVVVTVGRLFPVKGQTYLVEAMAELRGRSRVRLLLVGEGPQRDALEARVRELGLSDRVRFAGFRDDVPRLLRAAGCLCVPSVWENLPYAALEGGAQACPIVATDVGGLPELLEHGMTGLLVPPADPRALADAIAWLADHPDEARELGRAAHRLVRESFGESAMIDRTLEAYGRALS